jgi:hypothetical protein
VIVNLTPHAITIAGRTFPPDGRIPRVAEQVTDAGAVDGIPVVQINLGDVTGLPEPQPGTWYVVSRMTAEAAPGRHDLLIPGKQIRNDLGQIIGAESLARLPKR